MKRGYPEHHLDKVISEVKTMNRDSLMEKSRPKKDKKDAQTIFVCDWHPSLSILPSILKKNFKILQNNQKMKEIFTEPPNVAFRKKKSIRNHVVHNDIMQQQKRNQQTKPCGKCKLCPQINQSSEITNGNITLKLHDGGDCKSRGVIYAARCKKHRKIYIGQTGEKLADRFSKHRYDIKNRPDNTELSAHFHDDHNLEKDLDVVILKSNLPTATERLFYEDYWICRLQTLQPSGINIDGGNYVKEMYGYSNTPYKKL